MDGRIEGSLLDFRDLVVLAGELEHATLSGILEQLSEGQTPKRLVTSIKTYLKGATALLQLDKVPLSQEPLDVTFQDVGLLVIRAVVYTKLGREFNPESSELETSS
jgi:hypothetical protein